MNPKTAIANTADQGPSQGGSIALSSYNKQAAKTGACLHCLRPTRERFCCHGCEHVYHYIKGQGLSRYYSLRDQLANPNEINPIESIEGGNLEGSNAQYLSADPFIWKVKNDVTTFAAFAPTLTCAACLWLVRAALSRIPEVQKVEVNFGEKLIYVSVHFPADDDRHVWEQQVLLKILKVLVDIGYRAFPPDISMRDQRRHERSRKTMIDLAVSGAIFGNVMLFTAAVYLGRAPGNLSYTDASSSSWLIDPKFRFYFELASGLLCTLSMLLVGRRYFFNAWNALKLRAVHIDLPISFALALAYGLSLLNLIKGSPLLYFDSVSGLIFLLLAARAASEMLAERANRLADSAIASIPPSNVKVGDRFHAAPGDIILVDGKIIEGTGEVSEIALTGEATPALKRVGDMVLAGSQNLVSALLIEATASAGDSYVQRIRKTIAQTIESKPLIQTKLDLVLRWFVIGIFVATGVAVLIWWPSGAGRTIEVVCAVLIVCCPCTLALAIPLARSFALKRAWSYGAIIKSVDALEVLSRVDTIVVDKTGTLTTGKVKLTEISREGLRLFDEEELFAVKTLAERSRHPVSIALATYLNEQLKGFDFDTKPIHLQDIVESAGRGLSARYEIKGKSVSVKIGRANYINGGNQAIQKPGFSMMSKNEIGETVTKSLSFGTQDPIRDDTAAMIEQWQNQGLNIHLLSGDLKENVKALADELKISSWQAEVMPEQKQAFIQDLVETGHIVAMVGDGINDAAALAAAHVGIAVKGGADLALSSADMFLSREGMTIIDDMINFSSYTQITEKIVMAFGVFYNLVALCLALSGILHPLMAALIMPLSSISVLAIAYFRKGAHLWKSSTSSCQLPSPLPV